MWGGKTWVGAIPPIPTIPQEAFKGKRTSVGREYKGAGNNHEAREV